MSIEIKRTASGKFVVVPGDPHPQFAPGATITWKNRLTVSPHRHRVVLIFHRRSAGLFDLPHSFVEEIAPGGQTSRTVQTGPSERGSHIYKVYVNGANVYADGGSDPGIDVP